MASNLEVWDYVTLVTVVLLSCSIGLYHAFKARKSTDAKEFLVTNTNIGIWPLLLSVVATIMSGVGLLGIPVETYVNGLSFLPYIFITLISAIPGAYIYLPVFFRLKKDSIFEYLELRFSRAVRTATSVILTFQAVFHIAMVIYAPSLAISQATGLHFWGSVASIGLLCIVYTSMGGLKAVVWADVTQLLVMALFLVIIMVKGTMDIGGFSALWNRLVDSQKSTIFVWAPDPNEQYTFWTFTIAAPIYFVGGLAVNQSLVQRYLSNKTLEGARLSLYGGAIGIALTKVLVIYCGLLIAAKYYDCDPLASGQIKSNNQLMPLYAIETLSFAQGLKGVFIAGLLCATLSTISSALNSLTAISIADYVKPLYPDLSERWSMILSKTLPVFYGVCCIAFVAIITKMNTAIMKIVFSIISLTGGPIMVVYTVGMLLPWVDTKGAIIGAIASLILPWWAWIGSMLTAKVPHHGLLRVDGCPNGTLFAMPKNTTVDSKVYHGKLWSFLSQFYSVSSLWYCTWSLAVGISVSLIASKIMGFQDVSKMDPDLFATCVQRFVAANKTTTSSSNNNTQENGNERLATIELRDDFTTKF